jgi:hypothetical protein
VIAVAAIVLGVVGGLLSGGSLLGAARIRLRYEWVLLAAFVVQGVARGRFVGTAASPLGLVVWAGVSILLVVLLGANGSSSGALVAACGALLNLDVVLLNRGMPVVTGAAPRVLGAIARSGGFYQLASSWGLATWAGDALPLHALGQSELFSVGGVLLSVGVAVLIAGAMTRPFVAVTEPGDPRAGE